MTEAEKRKYFEFLKEEWKKAVKVAKEMKCEVYFDNLETVHLAELSEYFGEDGFAYKGSKNETNR